MKASLVVLSWNGIEFLTAYLDALMAQDQIDLEVIVVDNCSSDGSAALVAEEYPHIRLLRNEYSLGFAGGNNIGIRAATSMGDRA